MRASGTSGVARGVSRSTAESTFGRGMNAPAGTMKSRSPDGHRLDPDRQRPICVTAGRCAHPVGHFLLHQEHDATGPRRQ